MRTRICPLFSSPPRGIWQLKCPTLQKEFTIQGHVNAGRGGGGGGGGGGGVSADLPDALCYLFYVN